MISCWPVIKFISYWYAWGITDHSTRIKYFDYARFLLLIANLKFMNTFSFMYVLDDCVVKTLHSALQFRQVNFRYRTEKYFNRLNGAAFREYFDVKHFSFFALLNSEDCYAYNFVGKEQFSSKFVKPVEANFKKLGVQTDKCLETFLRNCIKSPFPI